jgi:hypothetical protein
MTKAEHGKGRMMRACHSPAGTAMVRRDLWEEIRRAAACERLPIAALTRRFGLRSQDDPALSA